MPDINHPIKNAQERIRDDIDPANTWVVSDTHFGHDNIVGFCHRPEDHEQVMIAEWRAHVPDDATVIHLGDISYGHNGGDTRFRRLLSKELTGKTKYLIMGNHDRKTHKFYKDCGFKLARPFSIEYAIPDYIAWGSSGDGVESYRISFSHYPWNVKEDGEITYRDLRLHGHIHNNGYTRDAYVPFLRQHVNLSVEQTKYRPVNLKLLLDAVLMGKYPETTPEQHAAAQARRAEAQS